MAEALSILLGVFLFLIYTFEFFLVKFAACLNPPSRDVVKCLIQGYNSATSWVRVELKLTVAVKMVLQPIRPHCSADQTGLFDKLCC